MENNKEIKSTENFERTIMYYLSKNGVYKQQNASFNLTFPEFTDLSNSNPDIIEHNMDVFLGMVSVLEPEKQEEINEYLDKMSNQMIDKVNPNKIEADAYDFLTKITK